MHLFFIPEIERTMKTIGETNKPSPPPYPLAGATLPSSNTFVTMGPVHMASYDNANIPYPRYTINSRIEARKNVISRNFYYITFVYFTVAIAFSISIETTKYVSYDPKFR